ncbi:hypothetical protein E4U42_000144 [Claviceps africana]|uniref:Hydrophobin n=1 Tax=Claviceps africana TaxID=83212 RepID=A0A8K0J0A1_9HYPO|nr:hypothetical protein E4U42_000144 [Claviceps africana]
MYFPTTLLAVAAVAAAAPSLDLAPRRESCKHIVCANDKSVAVDLGLNIDLLGIAIKLDLDLNILLVHSRRCELAFCCPDKVEAGVTVPDTCTRC